MIFCNVSHYEHFDDGACANDNITISCEEMTAAGFLPVCTDYVETVREMEGE